MRVFYFSDDFRHFFYQIRLAARCLWYTGILLLDVESATLLFIVELGMAMGFTPCSNIAQSVGDAILWLFDQFMAAADALEPCLQSIMRERARRYGVAHGRPWNGRCYTDDILIVLIGTARLVRAVVVWRTLLRKACILGAAVSKRQVGAQVLFLGVSLLATALVALVPEQKLARALVGLGDLLRGVLPKEATQKLLGLLVHLSFLSSTGRAVTAGMWRCIAASRQDPVLLLASERPRVYAWIARLRRSPAVPMDVAMRRRQRAREIPATALSTAGQSDAFAEHGTAVGGLGGFGAGTLWRADAYFTSIGPAEYLAMWVHMIQNTNTHAVFDQVDHWVDNLSALFAAVRQSAGSMIMQWLFDAMQACRCFQAVAGKLRLGQRWGVGLFMGDAASRNYRDALAILGEQLHINLEWKPLSKESVAAISATLNAVAAIQLEQEGRNRADRGHTAAQRRVPTLRSDKLRCEQRPLHESSKRAQIRRRGGGQRGLLTTMLLAIFSLGGASTQHGLQGLALAATGGVSAATNYGSIPGEHPRRINLAQIAGVDPLAEKWFYEVPSFFPPQSMPSVAMAVASLDAYMFDEDGRYEFAVRATEYVAFGEVATAVRPRAFWRELTALQLRPMVVSGAVRVFYVAEVEPVDEPLWLDAHPGALDWEDFPSQ